MLRHSSFLFSILVLVTACVVVVSGKDVRIGLQTHWHHTPLLQEASEYLAVEEPSLFWKFASRVAESGVSIDSSDRDQYEASLRIASDLLQHSVHPNLSQQRVTMMQIALSSRSFSPAVQLHRSLAHEILSLNDTDVAFVALQQGRVVVRTPNAVAAAIRDELKNPSQEKPLPGDHIFGGKKSSAPLAVLYGNLGTKSFAAFHDVMSKIGNITYIVRHRPPVYPRLVRLSGFGVEMHLKSTEYKVVDDAAGKTSDNQQQSGDSLEPVPKGEVTGLGIRIAQTIAQSQEPLEALQRLSQNFPSECHLYRKAKINATFAQTILGNQQRMRAGHTAVLINGRHVNVENVNFFELIDVIGEELRMSASLSSIPGVSSKMARALTVRGTYQQQQGGAPHYDVRSPNVHYLNDIEKDPRTVQWFGTLRGFLRQQWPGQPFFVRRNALTGIVIADASASGVAKQLSDLAVNLGLLANPENQFQSMGAVRAGLVLVGKSHKAQAIAKAFFTFKDVSKAMVMLRQLDAEKVFSLPDGDFDGKLENVLAQLGSGLTVSKLFSSESQYPGTSSSNTWLENDFGVSLDKLQVAPMVFVNGREYTEGPSVAHRLGQGVAELTQHLQMFVYRQQLDDSVSDIHGWWLQYFKASSSYSRFAVGANTKVPFQSLVVLDADHNKELRAGLSKLIYSGECEPSCLLTHIAVVDLATETGRNLVRSIAARAHQGVFRGRLAIAPMNERRLAAALLHRWQKGNFDGVLALLDETHASHYGNVPEEFSTIAAALDAFARSNFDFDNGLITNGRISKVEKNERISGADFKVIEENELSKRAEFVESTVSRLNPDVRGANMSDLIMQVCSVLGLDDARLIARHDLSVYATPSVSIPSKKESSLVIDALLDPLSEGGKKFGSILLKLLSSFDCDVNLVLNPIMELQDLPLKQFYRYVATTSLTFDKGGAIDDASLNTAVFSGLPSQTLFSMSLDVPDSWIVDAVAAPHDLDNLRIVDIADPVIGALYELTHLTVEGRCADVTPLSNQHPQRSEVRGTHLKLTSFSGKKHYDTLVMENGGYFQLKSAPGVWTISLSGRANELFQIEGDVRVAVRDFSGVQHVLDIARRVDASNDPLLPVDATADAKLRAYVEGRVQAAKAAEKNAGGGVFSRWFSGSGDDDQANAAPTIKPGNETINIFSLASGHLYERFLSIMIHTTTRSTKSPVKFWFLKQFLSPQFKRLLPELAKRYKFDFELVTYKWPRWLRRQTEKQRHIWAYKILFLDVLFPLDVERVIFVDADQVVKEDLRKLHTMDLQGAPYAFTPFCSKKENRRLETKGFRFWETGYWKDTLQHLPYHISALFVVDLARFRQMAAGDILRGSYQQLSADPNSLANLDQDLPNVLQQRLTIYSLPEEWLWCETWCTDDSFRKAKSIDLCNNPMNKVPKLDNARRIFPDWSSWDAEIGTLKRKIDTESHQADLAKIQNL